MALSDIACKNAKPSTTKLKLTDSGGLYLLVYPNGTKSWRQKLTFNGKEQTLSHGLYPIVSLADARKLRDEAKRLKAQGINPASHKKDTKREQALSHDNTFGKAALDWHASEKPQWSENHADGVMRRVEKDLLPSLGKRPLADITVQEMLFCLRKIESRGAGYSAGRTRAIARKIYAYARAVGLCQNNPVTDLHIVMKPPKTVHFRAMDKQDIADFLSKLNTNQAYLLQRTLNAIRFSLLTFQRPGEIRQARWEEIDFDRAVWTIPAAKMKMRRDHIVPLSRQAIEVLRKQNQETSELASPWVFPNQNEPHKPMSDGTVNCAIKRMGYGAKATAHGFRALARTTIREVLGTDSEFIERQLAHKPSGPLGAAYDRAQFLEQRKPMMQAWADYLDKCVSNNPSNISSLKIVEAA